MTKTMTVTAGTRAHAPDLDWSQVRETVLMLELAAGQIQAAMRDSNTSVDVLTGTVTAMADSLASIDALLATEPGATAAQASREAIKLRTQEIGVQVHHAVIAFQFYDKLAQRLAHVCESLAALSTLVADKGRLYNPAEWVDLQGRIRSRYTMTEERQMFEAVLDGMPVPEALSHYMAARMSEVEKSGGDIELF